MNNIPVTVIGGYLGAGKTTLLNQLLRQADGERLAVLVNDFGDIGIDAQLIESRAENLINLAGGCVCCSFGNDLVDALQSLMAMEPLPQRILIETSGVSMPLQVARTTTLVRGLVRDAVIVLADAQNVRDRATDRYVADTVLGQLAQADLIVLTKTDLVDDTGLNETRQWLAQVAENIPILETGQHEVARELLLGPPVSRDSNWQFQMMTRGDQASSRFESICLSITEPVDPEALAAVLTAPQSGVARAKGFVTDGHGQCWLLQLAGSRVELTTAPSTPGSLVLIGAKGQFAREPLETAIKGLLNPD
jgi:G3E family GTPase